MRHAAKNKYYVDCLVFGQENWLVCVGGGGGGERGKGGGEGGNVMQMVFRFDIKNRGHRLSKLIFLCFTVT